jgi:GntR family transcriptional regulator
VLPAGYRDFVINPRSRKPPYEQVAELLKARIESGKYPKDERIPSETELMAEFEIGRTTARKAVAWLRDRGLVETVPTRGTYVV